MSKIKTFRMEVVSSCSHVEPKQTICDEIQNNGCKKTSMNALVLLLGNFRCHLYRGIMYWYYSIQSIDEEENKKILIAVGIISNETRNKSFDSITKRYNIGIFLSSKSSNPLPPTALPNIVHQREHG